MHKVPIIMYDTDITDFVLTVTLEQWRTQDFLGVGVYAKNFSGGGGFNKFS
jgi:hypothetical protein